LLLRARDLELGVLRELPDFGIAKDYLRTSLDQLGRVYVLLGRRQELVATLEELGALDQSTRTLRTSARLWLRALELAEKDAAPDLPALRAQYPRKALDLLLAAEKQGWGSGNRLDEPLYAPLLAFPEYAALKARIAARAPAAPAAAGTAAAGGDAGK
jgi:hypothetical protein